MPNEPLLIASNQALAAQTLPPAMQTLAPQKEKPHQYKHGGLVLLENIMQGDHVGVLRRPQAVRFPPVVHDDDVAPAPLEHALQGHQLAADWVTGQQHLAAELAGGIEGVRRQVAW